MSFDQPKADHEIWKIWDRDWDAKLQANPGDTSWVTLFWGYLKAEHSELLDPSKSEDQQYQDLKSGLTKSGRLYKYRD